MAWRDVDVVVSHVIELVEVHSGFGGLSDELKQLSVSSGVSVSLSWGGVDCGFFVSLFLELLLNCLSLELDREWLSHPRMIFDLFNSWSLLTIVVKDFKDEVLEVVREVLASNLLPVVLELASVDQIVEVFVFLGLLEWEDSLDDNEEDYTA